MWDITVNGITVHVPWRTPSQQNSLVSVLVYAARTCIFFFGNALLGVSIETHLKFTMLGGMIIFVLIF